MLNRIYSELRVFLKVRFDLSEDQAAHSEVIAAVGKATEFKGTNLWILIFSIIVASVGLNMNSPAVIIGAMLISPLLGPIIGIGLAVGIYDFDLIKKSYKNFIIATVISVLASTAYFLISPISDAQSELLARTSPTIYDVFIAFFGGLAGIVAHTRRDKFGTVVPGVAIATALMPPLCTAGYGLATGNLAYFFGAFYLFFINSVFIALATFLIVRFLRFPFKEWVDKRKEKRVHNYIATLVVLTLVPSIYFGWQIVRKSIFERNANAFVAAEIGSIPKTQILSKTFSFSGDSSTISLLLVGRYVDDELLAITENKLANYGLKNTKLLVQQGLGERDVMDLNTIKTSVLEDFYEEAAGKIKTQEEKIAFLESELGRYKMYEAATTELRNELIALDAQLEEISIARTIRVNVLAEQTDTLFMAILNYKQGQAPANRGRIENWLKARLKTNEVQVIYQ
jgi:uncharacterized hydrophobic protein (TIGR00271 family)